MMKQFDFTLLVNPNIELLDQELKQSIANIDGIQYDPTSKLLRVVSFDDTQTVAPIQTIVQSHNPNGQTQAQIDKQQIQNALQNLRDFVNNPSPTNAQAIATEKVLCRAILYLAKNIYGWE